jgi:DNA-binding transcriptional LysR family regulator
MMTSKSTKGCASETPSGLGFPRTLDLNLFPIFLAVYDTGSVSAAAVRLRMSQPGVSAALARLRERIGDPLFLKTSRGMEPTSRARMIATPIRAMLNLVETEIANDREFMAAHTTEEFRIALTDIGETVFLPPLLSAIRVSAPRATVRSVSLRPEELEIGLSTGKVDLAIGYYPDLRSENLREHSIATYSFVALAAERKATYRNENERCSRK